MGTFADQLQAFAEKTKVSMETVVRKSALELLTGVVSLSPVDKGRFISNWMTSVSTKNSSTVLTEDKTGGPSFARFGPALSGWMPGESIYITNSLPYAYRLEYEGWSKKAPNGFVRITVQNWVEFVNKAVAESR